MKSPKYLSLIVIPFLLLTLIRVFASDLATIDYPVGYRDWVHTKTSIISEKHPLFETFGGVHHIYANETALQAMKEESAFPDGSILVFDLLGTSISEIGIEEGERRRLDVMQKDGKRFKSTDGWGFGSFAGDTDELVLQDVVENCRSCHISQKKKDFVFSSYRL
jgi:hypothetical protein